MGAFAGLRLAKYLLDKAQDSKIMQDSDFPKFLLYNLPIKGMDETGITDPVLVKSQLFSALKQMDIWGCNTVVIACNSVHCFYSELQESFSGKIVNLINSACDRVKSKSVGVLCSSTTRSLRLYEEALQRRGVTVVTSTDREQQALNEAVLAAISGHSIRGNITDLEEIIIAMTRRGAEQVIIGCTEIPLVLTSRITMDFIDAGQEAIKVAFGHG